MADQPKGFDVDAALKSGATEDQVYDYLKKSTPGFDFAAAEKQPGASRRQIIDYIAQHPKRSPAPTPPQPPNGSTGQPPFWRVPHSESPTGKFGPTPGTSDASAIPPGAVDRFASSFGEQFNPGPMVKMAGRVIGDVAGGEWGKAGQEFKAAFNDPNQYYAEKSAQSKELTDKFAYGVGAVPFFGPPVAQGYEQIRHGDVAGGVGTWAGMLGALALPHGVAKVAGKASELAPHVYGGALDLSLRTDEEMRQVRARGLGRAEPKTSPPDKPVVANRKGLKETKARITDTKAKQMARVNAATKAGTVYDLDKVLKPVYDAADEWTRHGASAELGEKLREMAENFKLRHPDGMGGFTVTPDELQKFKEVTDDQIRTWSKDAGDTTGGEKYRRLARTAFDRTLDTIPEVKDLNWAMHLDHALVDAIDEGLRAKKFTAAQLAETGMGITGIELISRGYVKAGSTLIVGAVVREAMRNPSVMTKLGVLLDKAGTKLPPAIKIGMTAGALTAWGARHQQSSGDQKPEGASPPGATSAIDDLRTAIERWVH